MRLATRAFLLALTMVLLVWSPRASLAQTVTLTPTAPTPTPPTPPPQTDLAWNPEYTRFRPIEYVTTVATGAAAFAFLGPVPSSDHPKWIGPILFDKPVRNAIRLRTTAGIKTALDASSYAALITPSQSLFDSIVLPALRGNLDVMWQLAMMDAQAYALSGMITAGLYDYVGRARPSYLDCQSGTSVDPRCDAGRFASFPSGHMSAAMTGAGLICAHHEAFPLYGGNAWDVFACVESLTVATGVGVLRLMADRHYASDVLVGGAIGFGAGYGLPMLLHYRKKPIGQVVNRDDLKVALTLGGGAGPLGMQAIGLF